MEQHISLVAFHGAHLWTRERARPIRELLAQQLESLPVGGVLVIDAEGVEVFDYSFAAELFGKTLLAIPIEQPGRFLVVENLSEYARENLEQTLQNLGIAMIERRGSQAYLLGKAPTSDAQTFEAIAEASEPVTAADLGERFGININAVNERLNKLISMGLVRREQGTSSAGRKQFLYCTLA